MKSQLLRAIFICLWLVPGMLFASDTEPKSFIKFVIGSHESAIAGSQVFIVNTSSSKAIIATVSIQVPERGGKTSSFTKTYDLEPGAREYVGSQNSERGPIRRTVVGARYKKG